MMLALITGLVGLGVQVLKLAIACGVRHSGQQRGPLHPGPSTAGEKRWTRIVAEKRWEHDFAIQESLKEVRMDQAVHALRRKLIVDSMEKGSVARRPYFKRCSESAFYAQRGAARSRV